MRILLLNYEFPPLGGGAGRATYFIAKELVRRGHHVAVLTSSDKRKDEFQMIDGFKVQKVLSLRKGVHECGFLGAGMFVFNAFKSVKKLVEENRFDLSHSFFSMPTGIISLYLKHRYRLPYVLSLRGSDVPGFDPYGFQLLHKILKPLNVAIWKNADRVVALSRGLRDLAGKSAPSLEMEVIYNGIDTNIFRPMGSKTKSSNKIRLVAVSRLLRRKGLHHLLQAVAEINSNDIQLIIVGKGNYEGWLKNKAKKLSLGNTVQFYGYCKNEDLPNFYKECDIFILPSLTESFGLVFAEAMACGLPIIGSKVGGIPEVVKNGEGGILITPGNVDELKEAIMTLKNDKDLRNRMGQANVVKIRKYFTWEKMAEGYEILYKEITNTKD